MDLSLSCLDGGAGPHAKNYKRNTSTRFLSFPGPIVFSFIAETHAMEHGLVWCNNHNTTSHFSSNYGLPIGTFSLFNSPHSSPANAPLECLVYGLTSIPGNEHIYSLAKAGASLPILRRSIVPFPCHRQNPLHTVPLTETSRFPSHLNCQFPTVYSFFFRRN